MKRNIFILLIALGEILLYSDGLESLPTLRRGYLDLSSHDFSTAISLEGEWAFYDNTLSPRPWEKSDDPQYVVLPGKWDGYRDGHFGGGTYHLRINIGDARPSLALYIRDNIQALSIWADGRRIYETGQLSLDGTNAAPGINEGPILLAPLHDEFDLIIQVSNWHHRKSGLTYEMTLGDAQTILKPYRLRVNIDVFIIGMAFTFFFIYMTFYIQRPLEKMALWFALLCFALGLRLSFTNTSQLEILLGDSFSHLGKKLEYLMYLCAVIFFTRYFETLLKDYRKKRFGSYAPVPVYLYMIIIAATPMKIYSPLLSYIQIYTFSFVAYLVALLRRGYKDGKKVSIRLGGECLFMVLSLTVDVFYYNNLISFGPIAGFSLFVVIFTEGVYQTHVLSNVVTKLESLTIRYRNSIREVGKSRREIQDQNKQLNWLALYDQLTGLPNRMNLHEVLAAEISRAFRNKTTTAVFYMDLDDFKDINDRLGHNRGDELLRTMADRLRKSVRKTDFIFRLGGDEFVLVCSDLCDRDQIKFIAEKLKNEFSRPVLLTREDPIEITVSTGVAFYPHDGEDMDQLIKNAELAMYHAKKMGRNILSIYHKDLNESLQSRINLTKRMNTALEENHYVLYYQAQIDGETNTLVGFEALIRWIDPVNGMIFPDTFIPIAEETGFIGRLGQWTLEESCRQIRIWQGKGYGDFTVSVNISAYQFGQESFLEDFQNILDESQVDPGFLKVELTETMLMTSPQMARRKMERIKEMGVKIALDDFGTGYSSLSYLNMFPVDYLKIDKAFIRDVHKDDFNRKLTTSIISLGKNLNLKLIAEGVETDEERAFVLEQGCRVIQGYYYSKPAPAREVESFFTSTN